MDENTNNQLSDLQKKLLENTENLTLTDEPNTEKNSVTVFWGQLSNDDNDLDILSIINSMSS